ncbi:unnamed protein product [Mytilus coruscus]|uniref:HYR domain-containing protein n=1 Tax=Mytilus coruscus TaxID=42192 RepID=A0A6J8BX83_MYTCO|nr:unnamed protein product [Mytilus coruscus]
MIKIDEAILGAEKYFETNCILVQLIVSNAEKCPYEGLLTLNNDKGKDYAVVNPKFPGAYNFFPKLPTRVDGDSGTKLFVYFVGNDTGCCLDVVVKILRCKQEVSNISEYEGGANCSNLIWGTSCNAACPDGKVSVGGPAVFTCEMDDNNMTYLQLDNDTVCQDSAYSLKCPKDITIYTDSSDLIVASITLDEWTFPISLDSNGKPWKIESQTAEKRKYFIGRYTNIVTATSSTGQLSSCKFDFTIKLLGCTVPQVGESTIIRAVPNKTYHVSTYSHDYEKKICKQGYGWKQKQNNRDFVEVKCVETSPGHTEWKNWNSWNCTINPSLPCRMDGCLEDSLQIFKLKLAPNSRHVRSYLAYKTCSASIDVQSSTKKICFHLAHLSNTLHCRRESRDKYLKLLIHMDLFFTLIEKVTPKDYSSGLTTARILRIVFGVLSAVCTTCAGGYCCFKRRTSKGILLIPPPNTPPNRFEDSGP